MTYVNIFTLYKEVTNVKALAYIFLKVIIIGYKLLDKIILNKDKLFTLKF
jgi:hypothetical protein